MNKTKKKQSSKIPYSDIKFVFNNLDKSELELYDNSDYRELSSTDLSDHIQKLIEGGFRLSLKWDDYSGGIQITATNDDSEKPSGGYATSARSSDVLDAFGILIYKIAVLAEYDLSEYDNEFREVRG